jgi:hypothetical protein
MVEESRTEKCSKTPFVAPNIFDRKFYVDLPTREDWSTECVDLVAPDGLVFFTDVYLYGGRAVVGVFFDILNVRVSYALGSHATVFQSILHFAGHGRQNNINLL